MKSFFPYHGLNDYYDRLAQNDPKYTEKRELLNQPMESVIEKIPSLYKCNPEWPICLFDFSFRN